MNCQEQKNEELLRKLISEELRSCRKVETSDASRRIMAEIRGRNSAPVIHGLSWARYCLYGMAACCTIVLGYAIGCLYLSGFEDGAVYQVSVVPDMMSVAFGGGFIF